MYVPDVVQTLNILDPGVVDYSFDFFNECGILIVEFLDKIPGSIVPGVIAQMEIHFDHLVIGNDTLDICFGDDLNFSTIDASLDFIQQKVILKCTEGDFYTGDFLIDTDQFFGVAFGSNQCNYIDNICVNNSNTATATDDKFESEFVISPNPSSSFIQTSEGIISAIYQLDGKLIMTPEKDEVNIQELQPGVYLAKVILDQKIGFQRIIKI